MIINNRFIEAGQTASVKIKAVSASGTVDERERSLIREHSVTVYVNEKPLLQLVCTPNMLSELVLGRLVTEGLIEKSDDVESLSVCESGSRARIYLREGLKIAVSENELQTEPTCCTDNRILRGFQPLKTPKVLTALAYSKEEIFSLIGKFAENASLHKKTTGTHSCYLSYKGEYQGVFEDIGRHNALDKAIGYALVNGLEFAHCILFTTGRVPVDMARKVITAGVPVFVSKSVPTAEAAALAKQYQLTLICRAWPDSYEVYNEAKM